MFKRVLLPVSGKSRDGRAERAFKKAMKICDGEIILLHVVEPVPQTVGGNARIELERENAAHGLTILRPVIEELEMTGIPFHARVEAGTIAETITSVADEESADIIVMCSDGRNGLADILLGSIAERVLRETDVDLMVVRK